MANGGQGIWIFQNMFADPESEKQKTSMQVMDTLNKALGKDLVRLGVQGFEKRFKLRQTHLSRRYTTRLEETLLVKI